MAYELHAYLLTPEGEIHVKHIFYGETEAEAESHFDAHVRSCPNFGPGEREGRVISWIEEVDELPTEESAREEAE
jgi:hypothetical protein